MKFSFDKCDMCFKDRTITILHIEEVDVVQPVSYINYGWLDL